MRMTKSEQLANSLKHLIQSGYWKAHDKLPSLRQQVESSGFSLMTVLNAYQELEAQGLIYAKEKQGYFIRATQHTLETQQRENNHLILNEKIEINSVVFHYLKSIQSEHIIPLGSAFPDSRLLFSERLMQTLTQKAKQRFSYLQMPSLPPGNLELRKWIAQRYCMQGIATDPADIVVTSGGLDALNLSLRAITQPGDYIVLQETSFYGAWQAAEHLGLNVITIAEHAEYGLDLTALAQAIAQYPIKACLLMLNSQNPTGFTVSDATKRELAQLLQQHHIYLIEDDVYEELYYERKPLVMKSLDDQGLMLHCCSFSKTLGAGFRVGWVYAGQFSEKIQHLQLMSTISVNSLIQHTLAEYVASRHYDKHLKQLRSELQQLKRDYIALLTALLPAQCEINAYASGYFLWLKLPEQIDSHQLYQQLLEQQIGIAPSELFNRKQHFKNYIRLNCSFHLSPQIQAALTRLAQQIQHGLSISMV